jgi:hypothetical protein
VLDGVETGSIKPRVNYNVNTGKAVSLPAGHRLP